MQYDFSDVDPSSPSLGSIERVVGVFVGSTLSFSALVNLLVESFFTSGHVANAKSARVSLAWSIRIVC